jgi:hypothetical protein
MSRMAVYIQVRQASFLFPSDRSLQKRKLACRTRVYMCVRVRVRACSLVRVRILWSFAILTQFILK